MASQYNPLVRPQTAFDHFPLDNAKLSPEHQVTLKDPGGRFCLDRFKLLTSRQQAELLADIAFQFRARTDLDPEQVPELRIMRGHLKVPIDQEITKQQAVEYYLDYPSKGRYLWLQEGIRDEQIREFVLERHFDDLSRQLPAIAFTLAHIYSGGYYGLLTAREDRDTQHAVQVETISEMLGFSPIAELVYYVNDPVRSKRLAGLTTAMKKATVLTNFASGLKQDEEGYIVKMTLGKRFEKIYFIDDEDKNLRAALDCLVWGVYTNILEQIGSTYRTPIAEWGTPKNAQDLVNRAYATEGIDASRSLTFWSGLVDELLSRYKDENGNRIDSAALIAKLKVEKRWMPDVLEIYDGRKVPVGPSIEILRNTFKENSPVVLGTQNSIVFNDIDRNILTVNAFLYVRRRGDPTPLRAISQVEFADHPREDYWKDLVASSMQLRPEDLEFGWEHFRDADVIRLDIISALYKGDIAKNPHNPAH